MAFARGIIVALEILMVVPVAELYCLKTLRTSIMDCCVSTKGFVSSAYCDNYFLFVKKVKKYFLFGLVWGILRFFHYF